MNRNSNRGRPPGSSWLNATDYPILERVADRMILDSTMKPTTAMRAVGVDKEVDQRRLRAKWRAVEGQYLREARARRQAAQLAAFEHMARQFVTVVAEIGTVVEQVALRVTAGLQRWADENPETIDGLCALAARYKALQIEARPAGR